jgi:hypothetical protein
MIKSTDKFIFSICENFHHIVSPNTFQFSDVLIVSRGMRNIGSTIKDPQKTLELGIQRKEMQILLYLAHNLNILNKSRLMRINLFHLILFHKLICFFLSLILHPFLPSMHIFWLVKEIEKFPNCIWSSPYICEYP